MAAEDCDDDVLAILNWKKEEKFQLLQALGEYGCTDVDQIHNFISTKSKEEIEKALAFYSRKAQENPAVINKRTKRIAESSYIPIACWAKLLTDSKSFEDLKTEIALAVRLIAEFEDTPPLVCTDKIDFKNIYHNLSNALEGKPLPNDISIKSVFEKCVLEIAFTGKSFINPYIKKVINNINVNSSEVEVNTQFISSNEVAAIRHLTSQPQYNPLNISESYLRSTN